MSQKNQMRTHNLARFMRYILGHKPDEFGLVPDREGFVTYKEFLWAVHEEPGWGYVREGHINEVLLGKDRAFFQPEEKSIRALDRRWTLDLENPTQALPKILFIAVRRKAHPVVMEKGLTAVGGRHLVLSPDREMAERIGRRRDQEPVVLEIMSASAREAGISFFPFGHLYLTEQIPAMFINGPPASPERSRWRTGAPASKQDPKIFERKREAGRPDFGAGTFALDLERDPDRSRRAKGRKRKGWKEEARRTRRRKSRT